MNMKIVANGKDFEIARNSSVSDFLESIGQTPGLVVVERNKQALSPSEANDTRLEDGDSLEIVKIVAGG